MLLSEQAYQRIDRELTKFPADQKQSAIMAALAIAQEEGSVSPKLLSSGIYTAMITTVAGLVVGIIAYLAYNFLVTRVQKVIHKMEYSAIEFIDLLQEPQ